MTWLTRLHFDSPYYFLLVPVILAALFIGWRRRMPALLLPSLVPMEQARRARGGGWLLRIPLLLEAIALLAFTVALSRPQYGIEQIHDNTEGIDILLAIDISGSMDAVELPDGERQSDQQMLRRLEASETRLDIAKREVINFIDKRPADRIGLIAFAGRTYTLCPPSLDHDFVKQQVNRLTPGLLEDTGTNIAAPIASATMRLKDSDAKRRVAILFTDGQNTVQESITPLQAADIAAKFDVICHTVGIGSDRAYVKVQLPFGGSRWQLLQGTYDEASLRAIAERTDGLFLAAEDEAALASAMAAIDALEKTDIEQTRWTDYNDLFPRWLYLGLALLGLAFLLEQTILLKVP